MESCWTKELKLIIYTFLFVQWIGIVEVFAYNDSKDLVLTAAEKNALEKFKPLANKFLSEEFMRSDFYLIRWLRQTKLDITTARNKLLQTVKWRKNNNISFIMTEDWSDLEEDYKMSFEGQDKSGRPILSLNFGEWDLRDAVIVGRIRRLQRYLTFSTEKSTQRVFEVQRATGKPVTRSVVLVNGDGTNLLQHACPLCLTFLVQWTLEKEMYYPDFTEEVVLFNVPSIGAIILNAVRPVMSPELNAQTKVFDYNRNVWMDYLDRRIDRKERFQQFGGTKGPL